MPHRTSREVYVARSVQGSRFVVHGCGLETADRQSDRERRRLLLCQVIAIAVDHFLAPGESQLLNSLLQAIQASDQAVEDATPQSIQRRHALLLAAVAQVSRNPSSRDAGQQQLLNGLIDVLELEDHRTEDLWREVVQRVARVADVALLQLMIDRLTKVITHDVAIVDKTQLVGELTALRDRCDWMPEGLSLHFERDAVSLAKAEKFVVDTGVASDVKAMKECISQWGANTGEPPREHRLRWMALLKCTSKAGPGISEEYRMRLFSKLIKGAKTAMVAPVALEGGQLMDWCATVQSGAAMLHARGDVRRAIDLLQACLCSKVLESLPAGAVMSFADAVIERLETYCQPDVIEAQDKVRARVRVLVGEVEEAWRCVILRSESPPKTDEVTRSCALRLSLKTAWDGASLALAAQDGEMPALSAAHRRRLHQGKIENILFTGLVTKAVYYDLTDVPPKTGVALHFSGDLNFVCDKADGIHILQSSRTSYSVAALSDVAGELCRHGISVLGIKPPISCEWALKHQPFATWTAAVDEKSLPLLQTLWCCDAGVTHIFAADKNEQFSWEEERRLKERTKLVLDLLERVQSQYRESLTPFESCAWCATALKLCKIVDVRKQPELHKSLLRFALWGVVAGERLPGIPVQHALRQELNVLSFTFSDFISIGADCMGGWPRSKRLRFFADIRCLWGMRDRRFEKHWLEDINELILQGDVEQAITVKDEFSRTSASDERKQSFTVTVNGILCNFGAERWAREVEGAARERDVGAALRMATEFFLLLQEKEGAKNLLEQVVAPLRTVPKEQWPQNVQALVPGWSAEKMLALQKAFARVFKGEAPPERFQEKLNLRVLEVCVGFDDAYEEIGKLLAEGRVQDAISTVERLSVQVGGRQGGSDLIHRVNDLIARHVEKS